MIVTSQAPPATAYQYEGIYAPIEVSGYLLATMPASQRPPTSRRIFRWIRDGLVAPEHRRDVGHRLVIDFEDLVTCQAITIFREAGCTLSDIRHAEEYFAGQYKAQKPFAYQDFWYSNRDIFGRIGGSIAAGTRAGQLAFDFILGGLKKLSPRLGFHEYSRRADCWEPTDGVTLRPDVQFGQSCLEGTRIPTSALWSYAEGGDSVAFLARSFQITVDDVERAVAWEQRVRSAVASQTALSA